MKFKRINLQAMGLGVLLFGAWAPAGAAHETGHGTGHETGHEAVEETAPIERVEVAGVRSSVMPYASWVRAVQPIHALSKGQLRQGVRLFSQDKQKALRVSVVDDSGSHAIAPLLGELFVVPHDLAVDGPQADLSVNRAEGRWGVGNFALVPQVATLAPAMAEVRSILLSYRSVYQQRFPLSWRLMSRSEASFDICSPEAGASLQVLTPAGAPLATLPLERTVKEHAQTTGLPLYCASVKADSAWADDTRLSLPRNAVALLGFRLL